ncbi:MAG: OsmC family peroxiredoxin [Anaerolineae bacterium]
MAIRSADARWEGTMKEGKGHLALKSGAFEGQYSFSSRFEEGTGTNPEELLGAAFAGCFTMALNVTLERNGTTPDYVHTIAKVHLGKNADDQFAVTKIELIVEASVPNVSEETFMKLAEDAKSNCIISRALNVDEMTVTATLK